MRTTLPIFWRNDGLGPGEQTLPGVVFFWERQTMTTRREQRAALPGFLLATCCAAILMVPAVCAHEVEKHASPAHHDDLVTDDAGVRDLVRAFRRTGDDHYLDTAWTMLETTLDSAGPEQLVDAAMVAQSRHDFDTAITLVDKALAVTPNNDQAWLLRAAMLLVQGRNEEAGQSCRALRQVPVLVAITCRARVMIAGG